ncbi:MAG: hypothetical protein WC551_13225 [Patescibacteria group bacterium]
MILTGYRVQQSADYGHLDARVYHALDYYVYFPTIEAAESAIKAICDAERVRIEKTLKATNPTPASVKKSWEDKVGAFAIVEERIKKWDVLFSRGMIDNRSIVSRGEVSAVIEQRQAWREVKQITRTGASGLEVVHELGTPGKWSAWHSQFYNHSSMISLTQLMFDVVPWKCEIICTDDEERAWIDGILPISKA